MKSSIQFQSAISLSLIILCTLSGFSQFQGSVQSFTREDTLRGSITPERGWWDLSYYDLKIKVDILNKSITGTNLIRFYTMEPKKIMQIDLQQPMIITKVEQEGQELKFLRDGNAWYITLNDESHVNTYNSIVVSFEGAPKETYNAPWEGGIVWSKDDSGNHFIATACQVYGASLWWPCKDHLYDEPDSMKISLTCPDSLIAVANGRLRNTYSDAPGVRTFEWFVSNPISNYVVNMNIADYAHFSEKFDGENAILDCDYYVLHGNLDKAKEHFNQVPKMLEAFEYWFGPYPFYTDGYKLVEVPYLGMEHQSSVTYGNNYQMGYMGEDFSSAGWGLKFDYLIVHESGHEWFANNITIKDIADMWVHESFTAYSESLFVEYYYDKGAGYEYIINTRKRILNDAPIVGSYNVNNTGSNDMYYKGANMLHTLRELLNDDEKWRNILRGINKDFYHQTVTGEQIENYLIQKTGLSLKPLFDQYLRDTRVPTLEYYFVGDKLVYRWMNCVEGFNMPVKIYLNGKGLWLAPSSNWSAINTTSRSKCLRVDKSFYVSSMNILGNMAY